MAPTRENDRKPCPARLAQGDTPFWSWFHPAYPAADGWIATLYIASAAETPKTFQASPNPNDTRSFDFALPASFTSSLILGRNHFTIRLASTPGTPSASWGTATKTVAYGDLWVKPDPSTAQDPRSWNELCLGQVLAAISARLTGTVMDEWTLGTTVCRMPPLEKLLEHKAFFEAEVKREKGNRNMRALPVRLKPNRGGFVPFGFNKWVP